MNVQPAAGIGYTAGVLAFPPGAFLPGFVMMKFARVLAALGACVVLTAPIFARQAPPAPALTPQQQNDEILKELRAIRLLLEKLTTPPSQQPSTPAMPATGTIVNLKGYMMGRPDAPLTMVEFTDLQCPFCRQYITTTFGDIKKNWIDSGRLRYISRDFPLDFHPEALPAARAARCAGEQGKFWEMRLGLMRNANLLTADYIARTASDMTLDTKAFMSCAASTKYDAEILSETREGLALGVVGTPSFVLGRTTATSVEGPMLVGAQPYALFDAKLKELLDGK